MAISSYQLPSPRAITPPAGEFQLASDPNAHAAALAYYMNNRSLQEADYGRELEAQHAFALQQMMANQHDEQQKNAISLLKEPGGGRFLASGNPLGMSLGGDATSMTNLAQAGDDAQGAKNFQANMTGLNQGSQGGYQLAPGSPLPPGIPAGMSFTNLGPALVQGDKVKAAASLAAAAMNTNKDKGFVVSHPLPTSGTDQPTTLSHSGVKPGDVGALLDWYTEMDRRVQGARSGNNASGITPPQPPPTMPPAKTEADPLSTVPNAPGVANGPGTQAAPTNTGYNEIDTNSPLGKAGQSAAMIYMDRVKQQAAKGDAAAAAQLADLQGSMNGAAFPVIQKADHNIYIKGRSGKDYLLGSPIAGKR